MSFIETDSYVADAAYAAALDQIEGALRNPGFDLRTRLVEILGEAGVWPIKCLEDRLKERRRRRERDKQP